jgi:hypothetical protein
MHIDELLSALGKRKTRAAARRLSHSLYSLARKGVIFTRPSNETYALAEWGPNPLYRRSREGVRAILLATGSPMHGDEILTVLGEEPTTPNRCRLASMLNMWVVKGVEFTRPAPSTWALIEWKKNPPRQKRPKTKP